LVVFFVIIGVVFMADTAHLFNFLYVLFLFIILFAVIGMLFMTNVFSGPGFSINMGWFQDFLYFWRNTVYLYVIVLNILLTLCIFYVLIRVWPLRYKIKLFYWFRKPESKKFYKDKRFIRQWQKVVDKLSEPTPENLKLAVIEADILVDTFLKKAGYIGDHMAERLSHIAPEVRSLKGVWDAHLLRNSLVHVSGSMVSAAEAKIAVTSFENFLKELGALPEKLSSIRKL